MVFKIEIPSKEEVKCVKEMARNSPEELDSRELWILEEYSFFADEELDEVLL